MIIEELLSENSHLVRRYSDHGYMIRQDQTGNEYSEAIDLINSDYTYTETDKLISNEMYVQKFAIADKIASLEREVDILSQVNSELTEANNMLTECLLEISEIVYE